MRKVEHRLRLDLLRGGNQGYIRVKRGENGARRLAIALYMHSVPYMTDAGTTAVFRAIKPDNKKLFNSTTITDNVVTVGLTTQTVAALGTVRCELSIYGTNNELLYSPQFDIIVEDYLYSDTAIESTDEYTDLTEAISKVNNIVSTEAARVAAENQRVANENARVSAEAERASAETARAAAETARATAETERASAETTRASAESSRAFSENIRKQAEKQRVSSETLRDTAETARSTAESGRRSAETARVQEFNAIKADAQDAATAEATRATNEAARVAAETNRVNAEQLRVALYNLWNNATASAYDSLSPSVTLSNKDGHKHFNFGIPSNSRERDEIEAGELESTALNFTGFTFYNIWEPDLVWDANISSYGLPSGIKKSFVLITGPAEITEDGNIDHSWDVPQTIFDGQNIYIRRLGVSHEGLGSEDDPLVVSYYNKDWEPVGGTADAVTYTPQTLTEEQKSQARTNIGALDVNIKTTPVDTDVTLFGRGESIVYVKDGWLKPCPTDADNELILHYRHVFGFIGLPYTEPNSQNILLEAKSAYALYQKGLASESIKVTNNPLRAAQVYVKWNLTTRSNKHYFYYTQVATAYKYDCTYCVEDDALTSEIYQNAIYSTSTGVGEQDSVSQFRMYTNPTEDMHIATKQYVDTAKTEAQQLGLTAATPGKTIKVKTVQDGKPTEWEVADIYEKPASGIPKSDLAEDVQTSLAKADTAISLGLTAATPGQIIKVKTVQDGKPTEWEAVDMPGGGWELIAHINVADDVEKDVTVWQYNNLPRYKCIAYKKVNLVGSSEQSPSGCFIKINNESSQASGMSYGKSGSPQSGIGMIYVTPFGWTHCKTGDANTPINYAFSGVSATYNALPLSDNAITSIELLAHPTYKIASGEIWLYGKKG